MMSKTFWGLATPLAITLVSIGLVAYVSPESSITAGVLLGFILALAQSFLSTGVMKLAWNKTFFYWVWGGGFLFRLVFLAATAYVIYNLPQFNLVSTLITMVCASTVFMVLESALFFGRT